MYIIDKETCISCGACEETCPVSAILAAGNGKFEISDDCIDCGLCAGICPVGCISAK